METYSCWRRGKSFVPPWHVVAKVAAVRVTSTPEGSAPAAAAPQLNTFKINGVGWLHSGGGIGSVSLWPGEEGGLDGDGLSDTSDSITDDQEVEEDG